MATAPFELIAIPFKVYWAALGTAFPAVDAAPSGSWNPLGVVLDESYSDAGVTVAKSQTINEIRSAASTAARKAFRTEESDEITVTVMDLTLETYRMAYNGNALTTVAAGSGTTGTKEISNYLGTEVFVHALLVRGAVSPYLQGSVTPYMQYEFPAVYQSGGVSPVFSKTGVAMLEMHFKTLADPNNPTSANRTGKIKVYAANALP